MRTSGFGDSAWIPTSGVLPMTPRIVSCRVTAPTSAAGDGRKDRDDVAVRDLGVERVEVPDVIVVAVDVDELVQLAVAVEQVGFEPGEPRDQVAKDLTDRAAVGGDGCGTVRLGAQHSRQLNVDGHAPNLPTREMRLPHPNRRSRPSRRELEPVDLDVDLRCLPV